MTPRPGMREGDNLGVQVKIGGDIIKKMIPFLLTGGLAAGGASVAAHLAQPDTNNLQLQVTDLKIQVDQIKHTTDNTDGKVETILRLMRPGNREE